MSFFILDACLFEISCRQHDERVRSTPVVSERCRRGRARVSLASAECSSKRAGHRSSETSPKVFRPVSTRGVERDAVYGGRWREVVARCYSMVIDMADVDIGFLAMINLICQKLFNRNFPRTLKE